jgi:DNA helicase-2/ATP-dependent DNA helicase PcrA
MIESAMVYLHYTTADPLTNLRRRAAEGDTQNVGTYASELADLQFEPERAFETVLPAENPLMAPAIELVCLDDPPRVTILDFTKELMSFQIGVYGLAARHELECEPQREVVRYIGERDAGERKFPMNLDGNRLAAVGEGLVATAPRIRDRRFQEGPSGLIPDRCARSDFRGICS